VDSLYIQNSNTKFPACQEQNCKHKAYAYDTYSNACNAYPDAEQSYSVKLYPQISAAALKANLRKEIAFWYCLRAINITGSGIIDLAEARRQLRGLYSRATFYRVLKTSRFWTILPKKRGSGQPAGDGPPTDGGLHSAANSGPRILIFGAKAVAEFFGITCLSTPKSVPISEFAVNPKAWLYSSLFPGQGKKKLRPISRASIREATGVRKRTQIRLEKTIKVKKYPNFAVIENGHGTEPLLEVIQGKYLKQRRLGNSYRTAAKQAGRSLVRKVNKTLTQGLLKRGGHQYVRRFFETARACSKARERGIRHEEFFIRVKGNGKPEWVLVY